MTQQDERALRVIRADRILDGMGGEMLRNQAVVVEDDRIREIRPWDDKALASLSRDADVVDLGDVTLLPGLIDCHVHVTTDADKFSADGPPSDIPQERDEDVLLRAVGNAQAALSAGVTTVCDCGAPNHLIFALREAIEKGVVQGPRLIASGSAITTAKGHGHYVGQVAEGIEEMRRAVAEQAAAGADFIKIMMTGGGGSGPGESQYSQEELQAAVVEARQLGKRVTTHCHGTEGIKIAVEAGVDRIEHCTFVKDGVPGFEPDIAQAIVQKGVYVCPTNVVDYRQKQMLDDPEKLRHIAPRAQLNVTWRKLLDAGVTFVAGSDAGISQVFCDDYALIMELMVDELGMSPMQAILAGTRVAAEALGLADEIGTLEVGKQADLVAVAGNPLDDIQSLRDIRLVMVGGEIIQTKPATTK